MYMPTSWVFPATNTLIVCTAGPPAAMTGAIGSAVRALDRRQALFEMQTMEGSVSGTLSQTRLSAALVGTFAVAALLLGAVGVARVVAHGVSQSPSLFWPASCRRLAPPLRSRDSASRRVGPDFSP
jgi:hypothetical protein